MSHAEQAEYCMGIDTEGELWKFQKGQWIPIKFNQMYHGYYPKCIFNEIAYCKQGFMAAGLTEKNSTIVFCSELGNVWSQVVLRARTLYSERKDVKGKINKILCDFEKDLTYMMCSNGDLVILPVCVKCLKIYHISDVEIIDGELKDGKLKMILKTGEIKWAPEDSRERFRVSWSFAKRYCVQGIFINLTDQEKQQGKDGKILKKPLDEIEEWLETFPKEQYIFFFCSFGIQSDEAANYAQNHGWKKAFSLGGIRNGFHVE